MRRRAMRARVAERELEPSCSGLMYTRTADVRGEWTTVMNYCVSTFDDARRRAVCGNDARRCVRHARHRSIDRARATTGDDATTRAIHPSIVRSFSSRNSRRCAGVCVVHKRLRRRSRTPRERHRGTSRGRARVGSMTSRDSLSLSSSIPARDVVVVDRGVEGRRRRGRGRRRRRGARHTSRRRRRR